MTDIQVYAFLEQSGIKGMRWGVRKAPESSTKTISSKELQPKSNTKRNAAIILGSAAVATAIIVGAVYAKRHMGVKTKDISNASETTKKFAEGLAKEPVGLVHSTRGKIRGFSFPQHGGLTDPIKEYDKSGLTKDLSDNAFIRYGSKNEKIAARFIDPLGRKDAAGRLIPHEVLLPEDMARGINNHDDVVKKTWPLIKDIYNGFYRSEQGSFGPGY